jgi:hypothetical protein
VGGGFSFDQLGEFRAKIDAIKRPYKELKNHPNMGVWRVNKKDDQPDFFLPPELSFVLQLKCAELVPSTAFSAGVTCRFPRVQR